MQIYTIEQLEAAERRIETDYLTDERIYAGTEHGLIFAEYLSDDEYLCDADPVLDQIAVEEWIEDMTDAGLIGDCRFDGIEPLQDKWASTDWRW